MPERRLWYVCVTIVRPAGIDCICMQANRSSSAVTSSDVDRSTSQGMPSLSSAPEQHVEGLKKTPAKSSLTYPDRSVGTAKSAASGPSCAVTSSSPERRSLSSERSTSSAAMPLDGSVRGRPSATPREDQMSPGTVDTGRQRQSPQVHSTPGNHVRPLIVRAKEGTTPSKTSCDKAVPSHDKTIKRAPSASTTSVASTSRSTEALNTKNTRTTVPASVSLTSSRKLYQILTLLAFYRPRVSIRNALPARMLLHPRCLLLVRPRLRVVPLGQLRRRHHRSLLPEFTKAPAFAGRNQ